VGGHAGPDPASSFSPGSVRERWTPDQVRGDGEAFVVANWDRAVARFRRAEAAVSAAAHTEDEALYDRLGIRQGRALQRLLLTPAPNGAASP
jgi:hypothetical protein